VSLTGGMQQFHLLHYFRKVGLDKVVIRMIDGVCNASEPVVARKRLVQVGENERSRSFFNRNALVVILWIGS
jgi:hypothetical protein